MNVFIHLKTIEKAHDFFTPITIDGVINANADNYSTSEVIESLNKLISDFDRVLVFLEIEEDHSSGTIMSIIKTLFKYQAKVKVLYNGKNSHILTLIQKLGARRVKQEELAIIANDFFNE